VPSWAGGARADRRAGSFIVPTHGAWILVG